MIIGIPIFGNNAITLNRAYIEYVANYDASEPLLINDCNDIDKMCEYCDGLILPGGGDVDPIYYGNNNMSSYHTDPQKDAFEREVMHEFINNNKPIFGICRGFQLIVRELVMPYFGDYFAFYQHIGNHSQTGDNKTDRPNPSHFVSAHVKSMYDNTYSETDVEPLAVNSMHHQGLVSYKKTGVKTGSILKCDEFELEITATTNHYVPNEVDLIIEGIKIPSLNISAVQWHPEEMLDIKLLETAMEMHNE